MIKLSELIRYEELIRQESLIKKEKEILAENIKQALIEQGVDESPSLTAGKLVLVTKTSYEYGPTIERMEAEIEKEKAHAVATGKATEKKTQFIKYQKGS